MSGQGEQEVAYAALLRSSPLPNTALRELVRLGACARCCFRFAGVRRAGLYGSSEGLLRAK